MTDAELREKLASIEHQRWAHWQKYMHSLCWPMKNFRSGDTDGLLIPQERVEHWERQVATPYEALSEREKDSDREQVDLYWPLLQERIQQERQAVIAELHEELVGQRDADQFEVECAEDLIGLQYYAGRRDLADELLEMLERAADVSRLV